MSSYSYSLPSHFGGWGGGGGGGAGGGGRGRRRRRTYGPRLFYPGFFWGGRGALARRRRDRRMRRRWLSSNEVAEEENRDEARLRETDSLRISEEEANKLKTLTVNSLDLHLEGNTLAHHTHLYHCVHSGPKQLVVRRGHDFTMTLTFDRLYDKEKDDLEFIFSPDDEPIDPNAWYLGPGENLLDAVFTVDEERQEPFSPDHKGWAARALQFTGQTLRVEVHVPSDCVVGEWDFKVRTRLRAEGDSAEDLEYDYPQSLIVLFNPWSPGDQVYFPEDKDLLEEEYVLNHRGLAFIGSPRGKTWRYGQFEEDILHICLSLLRKAFNDRMSEDMADAVLVARALSSVVNSQDERGVLVGNWSGVYAGGERPGYWTSSAEILRRFHNSGPVKYGQCWVFSHCLTAVCRALGLPCRSVTNFDSAHDTDFTCTIDKYFDEDGDLLERKTSDSIWNFHVWNEVWIRRPDLEGDCDGWQVIDATPQERSEGLMQCGPCPVKAVKRGEVGVGYDAPFVFSEVNADVIRWVRGLDGQFHVGDIQTDTVGTTIYTKDPTRNKALDITRAYKFPEGSEAERAAVEKAVGRRPHAKVYKDLNVWFEPNDETEVGKDLQMTLRVQNISQTDRAVAVTITARASHYWDYIHDTRMLAKKVFQQETIRAGRVQTFTLPVVFQQYKGVCDDLWTIRGFAGVRDLGANRQHTADKAFTLQTPLLKVTGPERARSGQAVTVTVTFSNPLPAPLTDCSFHLDGSLQLAPDDPHAWATQDGTCRMAYRRDSRVSASERVTLTVRLVGKWEPAEAHLVKDMAIAFDCAELGTMKGEYTLARLA